MIDQNLIKIYEQSFISHWDNKALTDYGEQDVLLYADVAKGVARLHIIYEKMHIRKGDKIAIVGRNSTKWVMAYMDFLRQTNVCHTTRLSKKAKFRKFTDRNSMDLLSDAMCVRMFVRGTGKLQRLPLYCGNRMLKYVVCPTKSGSLWIKPGLNESSRKVRCLGWDMIN